MNANETTIIRTVPAAGALHKVPGFDPLRHLQRVTNGNGDQVLQLGLPYKRLWFRLACPSGRLLLNPLRITDQMAIFEAQVFFQREDPTPASSFTSTKTAQEAKGYIRAAQDEALSIALDNAGFGIQLCDVTQSADGGKTVSEAACPKANTAATVQPQRKPLEDTAPAVEGMKQPAPAQGAGKAVMPVPAAQQSGGAAASAHPQEEVVEPASAVQQLQEEPAPADTVPAHMEEPGKVSDPVRAERQPEEVVEPHQEPAGQTVQESSPVKVLDFLAKTGSAPAPDEEAASAALTETVTASTSPAYTEDMTVEEIAARMTMEEAQKMVVTSGPNKGWTLAQVAERRPSSLKFFTTPYCEAANIFKAAATLMLQEVNQQKAG